MGSINVFSFFHKLPTDVDSPFPDTTALQLKQRKGKFHPFLHASAVTGIVRGKVILQPHGKEFFTWYSKHLFTLHGKHFFT